MQCAGCKEISAIYEKLLGAEPSSAQKEGAHENIKKRDSRRCGGLLMFYL
jgi:hypothetical protein